MAYHGRLKLRRLSASKGYSNSFSATFWLAGRAPASAVEPALKRLGLDGRLRDLRVGACSAGQRRRTALAPLIARQPRLWLLDEPHAGLDAESRDLLDDVVREAVANGSTVLLASHDSERVQAIATRTVTVAGGHVTADSAYTAPTAAPVDAADSGPTADSADSARVRR